MPLRRIPYALDEQIKQCAILFSDAWTKKQLTFSAELEEVTYQGDPEIMRHVWINLLSNAVKYTRRAGRSRSAWSGRRAASPSRSPTQGSA